MVCVCENGMCHGECCSLWHIFIFWIVRQHNIEMERSGIEMTDSAKECVVQKCGTKKLTVCGG